MAADLLPDFPDGVFFVNLAPVSDPALVLPTIARTLDVGPQPGQSERAALKDYLREKRLLLALDNFEQIIAAGVDVADLLAAAPGLEVLVTSREALHLSGEFSYAVPPLPVPPPGLEQAAPPDGDRWPDPLPRITQYEAVQLFIQRAQAAKADFHVTNANAPAVAEICYRLDGLPLAIELAAARVRLLPPEAILGRLGSRLSLLTGGARDLPARHQTLRNAIAWSYDLLSDDEKALFRRLAVPAGSFTLEAAEAVAGDVGAGALLLDGLQSLVDKSLLRQNESGAGEARFEMLDTLREYALEQLAACGEEEATRRAHALFYLSVVEQAAQEIRGPAQVRWYRRLEAEQLNWRAALRWARESDEAILLARLATGLWRFWYRHGVRGEGLEWLETAATRADDLPSALRGALLLGLGVMTMTQGAHETAQRCFEAALAAWPESDPAGRADVIARLGSARLAVNDEVAARTLWEESLALNVATGFTWGIADAQTSLGYHAARHGQRDEARRRFMQSAAGFRDAGDLWGMTWPLDHLGELAEREGDYDRAAQFFEEALTIRRELGLKHAIGVSLTELGEVRRCRGDYVGAAALYEESIAYYRGIGAQLGLAINLLNLGFVALRLDAVDRAAALFRESLTRLREINQRFGQLVCLAGVACVHARRGQAVEAARLFSATETLLAERGDQLDPADQIEVDREMASARSQLDEAAFSAAWEQGRSMSLDEAFAAAVE